uniref:Uncharacterized protein n=1 Tax=Tetranychus urticae TaxID=32264 RepID=T1KG26_TETUR
MENIWMTKEEEEHEKLETMMIMKMMEMKKLQQILIDYKVGGLTLYFV